MKQRVWTIISVAVLMAGTSSLALAQSQQPGYGQPPYGQPSYGQPTTPPRASPVTPDIRLSKDTAPLNQGMACLTRIRRSSLSHV
jgi:hypothetical protein